MKIDLDILIKVVVPLVAALLMSFIATPIVKSFAYKVGAIDVPKDNTRMHDHPIPRIGGLAIFLGFILSVILFADINRQIQGVLLGAVIVVITGAVDDVVDLPAWVKFISQTAAAVVTVFHGVVFERLSNPFAFMFGGSYFELGIFAIPVTILWIVAVTNSVNFIDGLDGLALGVSSIASGTMLVTALVASDANTAIVLAALLGACLGFLPANVNPAKMFIGDTGALLLGYVLAAMSVLGLFKFYAVVSFFAPFLILALPIFDEIFAIVRRLIKGQKPWERDRGHMHHRLIDLGLNQKQAVAVMYSASSILGLSAVVLTTEGAAKAVLLIAVFAIAGVVGAFTLRDRANGNGDSGKSADGENSEQNGDDE
ncbi:MAG: undecaprenyl/decaprenyl-phosphate alpha-N-acetylglucosaminyl 1-phosphate transferase [Oscillospiraceae bacterium]|nr:undecaprenyl/decaprenyl-phosphate alpha-N-acetylglucosaminyl 1-phosphate transferase [Oscillospiraceae bacterium]